jgi:hypothetical protein
VRIPAADLAQRLGQPVAMLPAESVVIPAAGADYVEEGSLAAEFAARFYPELKEIVIVSDRPAAEFPPLPAPVRVVTLDIAALVPAGHAYGAIYASRLIKLLAPLQARFERILMIDSDMMLLRPLTLPYADDCVLGCFRQGRMIAKVRESGAAALPAELSGTFRPYLKTHLNGAFLAATAATWRRLSPAWIGAYVSLWSKLPDSQPPTDQLPLCCVLDHLNLATVDLGDWVNWPVSKKIGGRPATVPPEVVGAHGGFPLAEWRRYLVDPGCELHFVDPEQTRKMRYLTDSEKRSA